MPSPIDQLLARIRDVAKRLESLPDDDPSRDSLLAKQKRLRTKARDLSNASRHPKSVEAQISMLEARLREIDDKYVGKGYAEKHLTKGFSDPGAYSVIINRNIEEEHAAEVEKIKANLVELRSFSPLGDSD